MSCQTVADRLEVRRPEQLRHRGNDPGDQIPRELREALQGLWWPLDVRRTEEAVPDGVGDEDRAHDHSVREGLDHIASATQGLAWMRYGKQEYSDAAMIAVRASTSSEM